MEQNTRETMKSDGCGACCKVDHLTLTQYSIFIINEVNRSEQVLLYTARFPVRSDCGEDKLNVELGV